MNKADEKELAGLHGELAKVLKEAITKEYVDEAGQPMPPPAAILNVARQFLKDNKIEAVSVEGSPLHNLADLPVFEDDNIVPLRKSN